MKNKTNLVVRKAMEIASKDIRTSKCVRDGLVANKKEIKDVKIKFTLKLIVDDWGKYKKGDVDIFYINLINEQNGLSRFPIDKRWEIMDYEFTKD